MLIQCKLLLSFLNVRLIARARCTLDPNGFVCIW